MTIEFCNQIHDQERVQNHPHWQPLEFIHVCKIFYSKKAMKTKLLNGKRIKENRVARNGQNEAA